MLDRLRRLLSGDASASGQNPDRVQVATCALLLEMAQADKRYDPDEEDLVATHLRSHFALDDAALTALLEDAREARRHSADLFQFAREINAACTEDEKLAIMKTLWRIVYADGILDKYEDALARQLAGLLRLSPRAAIDLKVEVLRDQAAQE
jgi:uncharacterized tellurite resistance protein B-like protein